MRVRIELTDGAEEDEVVIRCGRVDETVQKLCRYVAEQSGSQAGLTFYKRNQEYYFPPDNVLFFETEGESVYAHTADDAYLIRHRLYELEQMLPRNFVRVSKSAIVNTRKIYSVTRDFSSASLIQFADSHKQIYASRHYYRELQRRLQERSQHET